MRSNRFWQRLSGAAVALLISSGVWAATPTPDGIMTFTPLNLTTGSGAKLEKAVITYQGKMYDMRINGLGVGGAMVSGVKVTAEVYGLKTLSALEDTYVVDLADSTESAQDEISSDDLWLYGTHGVRIRMYTSTPGITIAAGGDEVAVLLGRAD
ncbi:MAG TPA: hypothetical protein PKH28_05590 [Candidatus Competibacteraceae bacterium]|nr:hypothetical protein [Candidatus Competibacteraceae bacterium]